ncbi:MAG TPA: right-handed parallel beta-helix repeat-containing protein, partial [Pirellula sp.]|nr:right-handed parallel beta-helix repeat-containing protein [Pirellula sp.]
WNAIQLRTGSSNHLLDNVEVRYGGDKSLASLVASVSMTLTNSVIRNSFTSGVRLQASNSILTTNIFQNNSNAAISMDLASNPAINGVTVTNNGLNGVRLDAGFVYCQTVWNSSSIPYILSGDITVPPGSILEIGPGQVIKASSRQEIVVDGLLRAIGNSSRPIILTSLRDDTAGGDTNNNTTSTGFNGDWSGLRLTSNSRASVMSFTEVRVAGDNGTGAIVLDANQMQFANSTVRNSSSRGITARNHATLQVTNGLLFSNTDTAIRVESNASASIVNSTLDSNRRGVVAIDTKVTLINSLVTNHSASGLFVSGTGAITASFNDVFNPTASQGNYEGLLSQTGSNANIS